MKNIIFSKDISKIKIKAKAAICIYHKYYAKILPQIENCEFVEFKYLCDNYQNTNFFNNKDTVVFVGANKFFTTSTRFHPVFEILQYGLEGMQRYSVDIAPYIGQLWRLWAHFSFANVEFGGYTYSYLLESHYNAFLEGAREQNPLSLENIKKYADGHVYIDYDRFFSDPKVEIVSLLPTVHDEYQKLKAKLFDENDKINPIIKGLSDFAKSVCPDRRIPQEHKIFETPDDIHIVRTDLKVDEYLTNKLLNKISEVNKVVEALQS